MIATLQSTREQASPQNEQLNLQTALRDDQPTTLLTHLECCACGELFPAGKAHNLCHCGSPLAARYDLTGARHRGAPAIVKSLPSMWRYGRLLPVRSCSAIVSLGEGWTPLIHAARYGSRLGSANLWIKDESLNPTATFKARGLSCSISMCRELGIRKVAIGSAGNAGSALAAYAAAAGIEAHVFMPMSATRANYAECMAYGAHVTLIDGLISDCGRIVAERKDAEDWFDINTLKEPYRNEGNKTLGYELAEQLNWRLPDVVVHPTGGGEGIIGMWKAFGEMEALGWIGAERPRLIAVQAEGCQPILRAWQEGASRSIAWENPKTIASGMCVPKPLGDFLILKAIRESRGAVVAVGDRDALAAGIQVATDEGIFPAPEAGACFAALKQLLQRRIVDPEEQIVIFNSGSGIKYSEAYSTCFR